MAYFLEHGGDFLREIAGIPNALQECMAGVRRFQDLDCWKLARMVRREVVRLTAREPVRREFKFVAQIRDAARGGTRNIAEGYSRFIPSEILYYLRIAKSSLDETADELLDGLESGYWSTAEYNVVRSYLRRTHGAIRGWWRYLESPQAARFYEQHKARIEREVRLGLRRPPKDPNSRPWRKENPEPQNPEPQNPKNPEPGEPEEPEEPGEPV